MESESLRSGTLNFWKMQGAQKVTFSILNLSSQMHFWSQLWPGCHFDGCSASLKCKSESLTRKLQVWTRILTNHLLFRGSFKISMIIFLIFSDTQRFEQESLENHWFSKENWHRGGTEKIDKSAERAASAIGVLRNFKSSVFAWRFFDFFGIALNGMQVFRTKMRQRRKPTGFRAHSARKEEYINKE